MLFMKSPLRRLRQCYTEADTIVHLPCSKSGSLSVRTSTWICCGNDAVWLIIMLCNHSDYCVSQRLSGKNLNEKKISLQFHWNPHSRWRSTSSRLWLKKGTNAEIGIIFTFFITLWSRLQIQTGVMPQLWVGASVPTERNIWKSWAHECSFQRKKKRKCEHSAVNAVIFYLKADLVVTSDDGFVWSF